MTFFSIVSCYLIKRVILRWRISTKSLVQNFRTFRPLFEKLVVTLLGALCLLELGLLFPISGGAYIYIGKGLGDAIAFLYAWTCILVTRPASGQNQVIGLETFFALEINFFFVSLGFLSSLFSLFGFRLEFFLRSATNLLPSFR